MRLREIAFLSVRDRDGDGGYCKGRRAQGYFLPPTPIQYPTQVRFWIHLKISTEYHNRIPILSENAKIKIPQVGTYFTL